MKNKINVAIDFGSVHHEVGIIQYSKTMNRYFFAYHKEFLSTGYEISPLTIPLADKTYEAEYIADLHGIHGVFADSLPDSWGMKVQDIEFEKIGIYEPTPLDRLAFLGKYSMGALRYYPERTFEKGDEILNLAYLRKAVQNVIEGDVGEVVDELLHCGGSAGGARPKFLLDINKNNLQYIRYTRGGFQDEYIPVIIKIPSSNDDLWQRVEFIYSKMVANAGIVIPPTYLIKGKQNNLVYFAIERFDRLKNGNNLHTTTFAGLINKSFSKEKHDYKSLLKAIEIITKDHTQVVECYKRMVFSYLGCNRDDHAKNYSFCMDNNGNWSFSPAYDIGFSKGQFGNNTMAINGKTVNPIVKDFRVIAKEFRISNWLQIILQTIEALKQFPSLAKEFDLHDTIIRRIFTPISENLRRIEKDL